ncbi:uncharacterized protein LOC111703241 [Eurytemora carolleeae]|uniref:uncharacterized protein LOC111703241 n=1 Tax=Eurytemora carolleeae TaxID=1294199 RepID=UPI000C778BE2|nr:uncharacterized protein LOC111703241 [Eurytemora carolleeae]|eukprot:XP_023330898.1 uncharacterized protein LOC111703241 [Eurytemora affinis]
MFSSNNNISQDTRELMKDYLAESRLTLLQRKGLYSFLRNQDQKLEKTTSTAKDISTGKTTSTVSNQSTGRKQVKFRRIRTRDMIERMGGYIRDTSKPPSSTKCITEQDKDKLIHFMEFRQKLPSNQYIQEMTQRLEKERKEKSENERLKEEQESKEIQKCIEKLILN